MFDRDMPEPTGRVVVNVPEGSPCWLVTDGREWDWACNACVISAITCWSWESAVRELREHILQKHPELLP